jgi:hypothetical protein
VDTVDLGLRVIGLLFSGAAVVFAFLKQRSVLLERVREDFVNRQAASIEAMNQRMRLLEVTIDSRDDSLEQCERQRAAAYQALDAWDSLIGNIWIDSAATQADAGD